MNYAPGAAQAEVKIEKIDRKNPLFSLDHWSSSPIRIVSAGPVVAGT
jgi:hypothetical protein